MKEENGHNFEELEAFDIHKFFMSENKKTKTTNPPKISQTLLFITLVIIYFMYEPETDFLQFETKILRQSESLF